MLALIAGILGLALTMAGVTALTSFAPPDLPRLHEIRISGPVLWFSLGISLLTGILFGLVPAWQLSYRQPIDALKHFNRTQPGGFGNHRIRDLMVAGEFALAVVLLTGAGLLVRSLLSLEKVDLGFRPDGLLMGSIELPEWRTDSTSRPAAFFEQAIAGVRALPGVEDAGVISGLFDNYVPNTQIATEGHSAEIGQSGFPCTRIVLSDDFFRVIGVPLLRGRYFTSHDNSQAPPVALINETMARQFWPGANPVNTRFRFGSPGAIEPAPVTVVGVVGDIHPYGPESRTIAAFYLPHRQAPWVGSMDLVIRARTGLEGLAGPVRAAVRSVDTRVPRFKIRTVDDRLAELSAPRRFETWLLGGFSAIGLLLAAFGIYGLLHTVVAQRTREIGIRMALGATPASVTRLVMIHGMRFAVLGIATGVAASLGLTRVMGHLLFGVSATDPLTFCAATAFLLLVAAAASYFPARRAKKLDPLIILRYD
jgi:putative ABC transport system permease protein